MGEVDILRRIIREEGNCCWADPSVCSKCPLGKMRRRDDGNYVSCIEAIDIEGLTEEQADAKYKEAAIRALLDLEIQEALED